MDFALDSAQDELNSQLAEVESRELKQIETAIAKISDGTYGICEMCQKNIPLAATAGSALCIALYRLPNQSGNAW